VDGHGQRGALVHIAQSPYLIADRWRGSRTDPVRAARSEAALALLGDTVDGRQRWAAQAAASQTVPTVLRKLGPAVTVDLLEHAYLLAMCSLHVLLDYPLLADPVRERVARLLSGGRPTTARPTP
jgi:hypothetical protein